MPYSDSDMEEIERDPVRLKAYFWSAAMRWKRMSRDRNEPMARALGAGADAILQNLDRIVKSTLRRS